MTPEQQNLEENDDWKENIRTDLWHLMNTTQLATQLDIIITKMNLLGTMQQTNPTVRDISLALKRIHLELLDLIDRKATTESPIRKY